VVVREPGLVASFLYHRELTIAVGAEGLILRAGIDDHFVIEFESGITWVAMQDSQVLEVNKGSFFKVIHKSEGDLEIPSDEDDADASTSAGSRGIDSSAATSETAGQFAEGYDIELDLLGKGALAQVYRARSRETGQAYAAKRTKVDRSQDLNLARREIDILRIIDHPNIVEYKQHFHEGTTMYLVMAYCDGEDMWDRLKAKERFTEKETASVMQQALRAVFYLHENHIVHRDLKPENFMFETSDAIGESHLQLLDFNLARRFEPGQVLTSKVGTPNYVSPETLRGRYDHRSDLWSIGVLMYLLLAGYQPFSGEDEAELYMKMKQANYSIQQTPWKSISKAAKEVIRSLLKVDTARRMTAPTALNDPWLTVNADRISYRF
jgi:calcium-dependent protein kinase